MLARPWWPAAPTGSVNGSGPAAPTGLCIRRRTHMDFCHRRPACGRARVVGGGGGGGGGAARLSSR